MNRIARWLIKGYRLLVRPYLGSRCRFTPSCSAYAEEAFEKKSFPKACLLTLKRVLKCGPWHPGGEDRLN